MKHHLGFETPLLGFVQPLQTRSRNADAVFGPKVVGGQQQIAVIHDLGNSQRHHVRVLVECHAAGSVTIRTRIDAGDVYVMPPDSFDTIAMWKSVATASVPDLNMWSGLIVAVYTVSDHLT